MSFSIPDWEVIGGENECLERKCEGREGEGEQEADN